MVKSTLPNCVASKNPERYIDLIELISHLHKLNEAMKTGSANWYRHEYYWNLYKVFPNVASQETSRISKQSWCLLYDIVLSRYFLDNLRVFVHSLEILDSSERLIPFSVDPLKIHFSKTITNKQKPPTKSCHDNIFLIQRTHSRTLSIIAAETCVHFYR